MSRISAGLSQLLRVLSVRALVEIASEWRPVARRLGIDEPMGLAKRVGDCGVMGVEGRSVERVVRQTTENKNDLNRS